MKNPEEQSADSESDLRLASTVRSNPAIALEQFKDLRSSRQPKTAQPSQAQIDRRLEEGAVMRSKVNVEDSGSLQQLEVSEQNPPKEATEKSKVLTQAGDGANSVDVKYKKALSEVSRLLKINKELKIELDSTKLRNVGGPEQAALIRQNDQLKFTIQRLQTTVKQLQSTNRLYTDQLNDYQGALRNHRAKSQQKIADLTSAVRAKENQLRELRQTKAALENQAMRPNEVIFQLKVAIERYKKQETVWQGERRELFNQILELQKELEQGKVEREKLTEHLDVQMKEQGLALRRELQKEIFEYKAENSNLKQSLEILTKENQRLTREIKLSYDATLDKHRDEAKLVWELTCQLEDFRQEGAKLRQALLVHEQTQAESQIIRNQLIQANHTVQMMNSQNQQLRRQVAQLQQEIEKLKSKTPRSEINVVDPLITSPSGKGLDYTREKQIVQNELRATRLEAEQLRGENHMLSAEVEELHSQLQKQALGGDNMKAEVYLTSHALNLQGKLKEFRLRIDLLPNLKSKEHEVQRELALLRSLLSELQASIRTVVADNQHSLHRARKYKDKLHVMHSKYDSHFRQNKKMIEKVAGYEKLVQKYEKQLQKQYQLSKVKQKVNPQHDDPAQNLTKVRDLEERLVLQEKHFQQEVRTRQLEFDTKLLAKKLEIDQLREQLGSFELYKNKITELSDKVIQLEALNNQYWMRLSCGDRSQPQVIVPHANTEIVALIQKITEREDKIIQLEYHGARLKQAYQILQRQYKQLELSYDSLSQQAAATKSRLAETHIIIQRLNQDLSTYQSRLNELSKYRGYQSTLSVQNEQHSAREKERNELRVLAKKLSEEKATLEYQLNIAKNNLALKSEEVSQLREENGQQKNTIDEMNYQVERLRREILTLTASLSSEKSAAESAELHSKRTIQELKSRIVTNQAEVTRLRDVEAQLQQERGQIVGVKTQSVTLHDRVIQLESQLKHYTEKQAKQQSLQSKLYEKQLQSELELSSLRLQKQRLDKLREHLLNQIDDLQQLMSKQRKAHSEQINKIYYELQERNRNPSVQLSPQKNYASDQFKDQNTRLQEEVRSLRSEVVQLTEKSNELRHLLFQQEIQGEQAKNKMESYIREIQRLRGLLKSREDQMNGKMDKLLEAEKISKEMEYEIYNLKVELQKLEQIKLGNSELSNQLQRLRKLNQDLQVDLGQLRIKYSNENSCQQRLKENLAMFVLMFVEIESLRSQLKRKQVQLNESRRSSLAMISAPMIGQSPSPPRKQDIPSPFTRDRISSPIIAITDLEEPSLSRYSPSYGVVSPDVTKLSYQTDSSTSIFPR